MNLLKNKIIGGLFRARWFPIVPQLAMLTVFGLLIAGGFGVTTNDPDLVYVLRYTNLANLTVWSLWWPVIIIAAVLFGRLWCTVCPMELITYWAGRIGLKLQVPHFLKTGWVVTIFYTLVWVVGVQTLAVNRIPHQMSLYMLFLIILAADVSLIFEKRAFCSYICPVGHMLGLYALISPFEWRADNLSTCRNCTTKDCVTKKNNYRAIGRSCTSNLYPASISDNRDCLLCSQCLKACPNKNIRFSIRKPFADFFKNVDLTPAQIGFIMLIGGFVVYEVLSEWPVSYMILMWIPDYCINALGITGMPANFLSAIIMFVLLPALLFLIVAALAKLASRNTEARFGTIAGTFALLLLPTAASAHIIKSIIKMSNQIPFWRGAISDPRGLETAQKIISGAMEPDYSITDALDPAVSVIVATILLVSLAATMLIFCRSEIVQKHPSGVKKVLLISVLAYWSIFALMIFNWRFG